MNKIKIEALRSLESQDYLLEFTVPEELKNDEQFMLVAITKEAQCIKFIGQSLYSNRDFILTILLIYQEAWTVVSGDDGGDPFEGYSRRAVYSNQIYEKMDESLKSDPDIMLELLTRKAEIPELETALLGNGDFLVKAVKYKPECFKQADQCIAQDVDFIRGSVASNPIVWSYLSGEQKDDTDIREALGDIKRYLLDELGLPDEDPDYDSYVEHLPIEITSNREFARHYFQKNYWFLSKLSHELKDDLEIIKLCYEASEGWPDNEDFISANCSPRIQALLRNSNDHLETLTHAIESEKLHGKMGVDLKPKDEAKLTPRQRKQQSGPVL